MNIIIPVTISSANFLASSILENEYSEWADGGFDEIYSGLALRHISRSGSGKLWAYVYGGYVYYSDDDGLTWTNFDTTAQNWNCLCCLNQDIYIGVNGGKIWVITNETGTLTELSSDSITGQWMCLGSDGTNVYGFNVNVGCYKRSSGAGAFSKINSIATLIVSFAYASTGICYLGTGGTEGIYASADGCVTYGSPVYAGASVKGLAVDSSGNVYATVSTSVLARRGGTGSFTDIGLTLPGWALGLCCDASNNIYASDYNLSKIYKCISTTSYSDGTCVQVTTGTNLSDHKIYESLTNLNIGNNPVTDTTNWLLIGNTNRAKGYDSSIADQSSASESITSIYAPGAIGAISILNHESSTISIIEIRNEDALINTTAWTGSSGTTQPTGWDKVGTPSNFTIDSGALKMTVDANGEGISKTVVVTAATEYQLMFTYMNTSGDIAQVAIYDESNASDILAVTDLPSVTGGHTPYSYVFTTPAGCISLTVKLLAKTAGDIVWFDYCKFAPTIYSETITTGALVTYSAKTDLVSEKNCNITVVITNTGSTAKVGEIVMGPKYDIGGRGVDYGISWGVKDWSTIEADVYGHYDIVEREKSKWMKCSIDVPIANVDYVSNLLAYYMSTYLMFLGSETNQAQMIYGFVDDWSFSQDEPSYAKLSLSITGIT